MLDSTVSAPASAPQSASPAPASPAPAAQPKAANPPQGNKAANPGKTAIAKPSEPNGAKDAGKPAANPTPVRSLEELQAASARGRAIYSPEEKRRVRLAAELGLKTDAEIDAKLAEAQGQPNSRQKGKQAPGAKPPVAKPEGQQQAKPAQVNPSSVPAPRGPYAGIPDPEPQDADGAVGEPGENNGEDDGALAGGDEENQVVNDADDPFNLLGVKNREDKKALGDAIRFHKGRSDDYGRLTNGLKQRGVTNAQHLFDSLDALVSVDGNVKNLLSKGPQGVAELYRIMQMETPAWMGVQPQGNAPQMGMLAGGQGGQGGQAGQFAQQGQPGALPLDFSNLQDDAMVDGKFVKSVLPQLLQQTVAQLMTRHVAPLNQRIEQIMPELQNLALSNKQSNQMSAAFRDVRTAMSAIAEINPDYKLEDSPENIWNESVLPDGSVVEDPHPEWQKLASILKERSEALRLGFKSMRPYLADRLLRRGHLKAHVSAQANTAKLDQAQARQRRLQPGLSESRVARPDAGFKMPSAPEEARQMKIENPEAYAEYRRRLKTGDF